MRLVAALLSLAPIGVIQAQGFDPNTFGGSPTPIGAGARSLGMGGAFVAIADDATANTWNPAGMTQLERPEAALTAGYARRRTESDAGVDNRDDLGIDHVSVVLPFHLGVQQTIGLAWQRQFDFTKGIAFSRMQAVAPDQLDIRSFDIDQEGSFATLGLSYAFEPLPGLAFGATLFDWDDEHTFGSSYEKWNRNSTIAEFVGVERRTTELRSTTDVSVQRGLSTVLGAWWQATPQVTVGVNLKPRYTLHLTSREDRSERVLVEDTSTSPSTVTSDTTTNSASTSDSELVYPTSATLAAAIRFGDLTTVSLDATVTRWEQYRTTGPGADSSPLHPNIDPSDYRDGWSIRMGLERVVPLDGVMIVPRCGLLYEETPGVTAAPDLTNAGDVEAHMDRYYGMTLGTSVLLHSVIVDIAGQVRMANGVSGENAPPDEATNVRAIAARISLAYLF